MVKAIEEGAATDVGRSIIGFYTSPTYRLDTNLLYEVGANPPPEDTLLLEAAAVFHDLIDERISPEKGAESQQRIFLEAGLRVQALTEQIERVQREIRSNLLAAVLANPELRSQLMTYRFENGSQPSLGPEIEAYLRRMVGLLIEFDEEAERLYLAEEKAREPGMFDLGDS
jgi:hypothetical protein